MCVTLYFVGFYILFSFLGVGLYNHVKKKKQKKKTLPYFSLHMSAETHFQRLGSGLGLGLEPAMVVWFWCWLCWQVVSQLPDGPTNKQASKQWRLPSLKGPTLPPDSNQQPTAFIRPLRCLLSDPFGRKVALKHTASTTANYTVAYTFCTCTRCKKSP